MIYIFPACHIKICNESFLISVTTSYVIQVKVLLKAKSGWSFTFTTTVTDRVDPFSPANSYGSELVLHTGIH